MKAMSEANLITSIEPDPRGLGAVRVSVEGRVFCTIPSLAAAELGLRPGRVLDDDLRARLTEAADAQAAYRYILVALGRRGFARRDLERRLVHRGHPREAARAAVERAANAGLLDDQEYAATYAQTRSARGRGPARLLRDLFAMGVDRAVAEKAVGAAWLEESQVVNASRALAAKRAAQLDHLPRPVKRRRVLAYLARRGFSGPEIRQMVSAVVA
jgi:regulatory protein